MLDAIPLLNQHGQSSKAVAIFLNTMGCSSSPPRDTFSWTSQDAVQ